MTDDFLRRHPEIVDALDDALINAATKYEFTDADWTAITAVIPLIIAAHEADLAGDAGDLPTLVNRLIPPAVLFGVPNEQELQRLWDRAMQAIAERSAAAYAQGRAAGREEAVKLGDDRVDGLRWAASDRAASNDRKGAIEASAAAEEIHLLVEEIRSLP